MAKILTPNQVVDAFAKAGKTTTLNTLRRWRRANTGPPWTMHGGKPVYRSDMIFPGDLPVRGYVELFPDLAGGEEVVSMSEADSQAIQAVLSRNPRMKLEASDDLFVVIATDEVDTSDPVTRKVLGTLAKMARGSR